MDPDNREIKILWQGTVTNHSLPLPNAHPARIVQLPDSEAEVQLALLKDVGDLKDPNVLEYDETDWVVDWDSILTNAHPPIPDLLSIHAKCIGEILKDGKETGLEVWARARGTPVSVLMQPEEGSGDPGFYDFYPSLGALRDQLYYGYSLRLRLMPEDGMKGNE